MTDNFYNNIVYSRCWVQNDNNDIVGIILKNRKVVCVEIDDKRKVKKQYKHRDFELYGKYLFNDSKLVIPSDIEKIMMNINV